MLAPSPPQTANFMPPAAYPDAVANMPYAMPAPDLMAMRDFYAMPPPPQTGNYLGVYAPPPPQEEAPAGYPPQANAPAINPPPGYPQPGYGYAPQGRYGAAPIGNPAAVAVPGYGYGHAPAALPPQQSSNDGFGVGAAFIGGMVGGVLPSNMVESDNAGAAAYEEARHAAGYTDGSGFEWLSACFN